MEELFFLGADSRYKEEDMEVVVGVFLSQHCDPLVSLFVKARRREDYNSAHLIDEGKVLGSVPLPIGLLDFSS